MSKRIATSNMAEVLYLLDRHHRVIDAGVQAGWPYGIIELCVTLEGQNIDLDHSSYLRHGGCEMTRLPAAFDAVMAVVWRKAEDASSPEVRE
jgi:hypothetical protein